MAIHIQRREFISTLVGGAAAASLTLVRNSGRPSDRVSQPGFTLTSRYSSF